MTEIVARPLSAEAFAPFGDVLDAAGAPDMVINRGLCGRYHDRAKLDVEGCLGISVFDARARQLPYDLDMVERHPLGSQAFLPMQAEPFLVVVAPDEDGVPGTPAAFLAAPGQGVNYLRGTWHGVLTPLSTPGLFAVIDRVGGREDLNLEEYFFSAPHRIVLP
ncbi:MAG: ureidoglycolate lyase [Pseudomonadota bacterium]